jgi:hypothetical protein
MFRMEDVMEELYKEFPEIEEKSINKICHDGLMGILKLARIKEEVSIKTENNEEIKFFVPCTPKAHEELLNNNRLRRFRFNAAKQKQNGEKSK